MKINAIFCTAIIILAVSSSCQTPEKEEIFRQLEGNWRFLGNWKESKFQQDTLKVYFNEVPYFDSITNENINIISKDTFSYDIVTDSGIWKITTVKEEEMIEAQPNPYFASIEINNDSGWYVIDHYTDTLKVMLTDRQVKIYSKAVVDEYTMDTLINESSGTIDLIAEDTMHIIWDTGITSKHKKIDYIP